MVSKCSMTAPITDKALWRYASAVFIFTESAKSFMHSKVINIPEATLKEDLFWRTVSVTRDMLAHYMFATNFDRDVISNNLRNLYLLLGLDLKDKAAWQTSHEQRSVYVLRADRRGWYDNTIPLIEQVDSVALSIVQTLFRSHLALPQGQGFQRLVCLFGRIVFAHIASRDSKWTNASSAFALYDPSIDTYPAYPPLSPARNNAMRSPAPHTPSAARRISDEEWEDSALPQDEAPVSVPRGRAPAEPSASVAPPKF